MVSILNLKSPKGPYTKGSGGSGTLRRWGLVEVGVGDVLAGDGGPFKLFSLSLSRSLLPGHN